MVKVNVNDRASLERAYPQDAFVSDAAQNEQVSDAVLCGVRVGSAPDADGSFELERAKRHAGEQQSPDFLTPVRRDDGPAQPAGPAQRSRYQQFLDDIVAAAQRFGFRADETPSPGDVRLKGLRGG
jgi:hypothetical protein